MNRAAAILLAVTLAIILGLQGFAPLTAQSGSSAQSPAEAREALSIARAQQRSARQRAERLEQEAERAEEAAGKAQVEAAALAARVQQAEASVAAAEAELSLIERERRELSRDLARRRAPVARLTAALETMARRPLALAVLQPGSLRDVVHTRAVLGSTIPVVRQRTASLRGDLDRARGLESERSQRLAERRDAQARLDTQRRDTLALAEKERVLAARAAGGASREAERAVVLAEEARDLDTLVSGFEQRQAIRARLSALDGPVARPADPASAKVPSPGRGRNASAALGTYVLPVAGSITAGFGESMEAGSRRPGIVIAPRPGALVVAPGAGRVAFAGAYEGYGRIVIIEHEGGYTSLVTGLAEIAVTTGQVLRSGSPLGRAERTGPEIALELRRGGKPVNPLDSLR
ncbi:murein hydrolase activator EnvC family protein [Qipengyuania sphaerica]|uniref:murein hydrolase activator EnvC family protein n=1 Tax=Qipengyuania sphaerica TaxID=2867243 RepID=UPI001C874F99|nr:peptidoglycan DD-metalloendopeptidase family protein [Qipengyuania sphaerica]MBX7541481.1 peptidoglycan DD-metalloendopeptidase family protein [Qipengyuania sphaerica]